MSIILQKTLMHLICLNIALYCLRLLIANIGGNCFQVISTTLPCIIILIRSKKELHIFKKIDRKYLIHLSDDSVGIYSQTFIIMFGYYIFATYIFTNYPN